MLSYSGTINNFLKKGLTLLKTCVKITYVNKKSEVIRMKHTELMEKYEAMVRILGKEKNA